ncbi:MAG: hypothetical protein WBE68_21290 [Candidatus Nitrosopolaris sp.]
MTATTLEYYYINDPVVGKTANLPVKGGTHRVATPIIGGLYSYHIYPMMVILILVGFGSLITYLVNMRGAKLRL